MLHLLRSLLHRETRREPPTVALITDCEQDRRLLREVCDRTGFDLVVAASCEEAISRFMHPKISVILYDRDLTDLDWRTAIRRLSSTFPVCVILTSPVVDDYLSTEALRCGGYDVLPKPLREEHLLRAIRLALSYSSSGLAKTLAPRRVNSKDIRR